MSIRRARHTGQIVITRQVLAELIDYCTDPTLLRDMLRRAASLAMMANDQRAAAVVALDEFCQQAPCILWQPEHRTRHVDVPLRNQQGSCVISVARVLWTAFHVVPEQGSDIRGLGCDEEILHTCGTKGQPNTGYGSCLNPAHMVAGDETLRMELARARRVLRSAGLTEVRA
jgi:hypothetical protein